MPTPLTDEHIRRTLEETLNTFAALLAGADEAAEVSTCPGWTIRDLAVHLGTVHRWSAGILLSGEMPRRVKPIIEKPLHEWYRGTAEALLAAIDAVAPDEPIPNFTKRNEVASFWPRRQLHETIIHLRDLTLASNVPDVPVTPEIAADGVDELFAVSFPVLVAKGSPPQVAENVLVRTTDTNNEWVLSAAAPGELAAPGAEWRASLSGSASDLYFGLWGRLPHSRLLVEGAAAEALLAGPTSS